MSIVGDQQKVGHFVPKTCQIFKVCLSPSICMGSTSSSLYSVIYLYHHQILTNNWINVTFALWYRFFLLLFSWSSVLLTCVCVSCLPFPMLANLYQCTVHLQTRKKNVCIQGVQLWSLLLIVHVWLQIACPFYIFIFSWFHSISHFFFERHHCHGHNLFTLFLVRYTFCLSQHLTYKWEDKYFNLGSNGQCR